MMNQLLALREFATDHFNLDPDRITALAGAGSNRQYFRILIVGRPIIGTWSEDIQENEAFFYLSRILSGLGVPVPRVIAVDESRTLYLQDDCGSYDALSLLADLSFEAQRPLLEKIIDALAYFHLTASSKVDFLRCYPSPIFGYSDILADLHYFETYFVKPTSLQYDAYKLRQNFERIALDVLQCGFNGLMYRDFQTRNIMVNEGKISFIDFQGARRGPCLYDVISLLFQAKLGLSAEDRNTLFRYYGEIISGQAGYALQQLELDRDKVLPVRLLQVLGAYGRRGLVERKPHFIESITPAIENLKVLLNIPGFFERYEELSRVLNQIIYQKSQIL
jgi:aminoglycoside/choline kinase family phosphotransferase